jgi:PAS domain S-box-containing protein
MNSVTFGIIRSCFAGIGQQIQLSALDSAVKSPLTKALTDFLEMYDQLNPRDVAGAESITEPVPAVSINMVDLLEEVTSSFNMSKRAGNDGLTITASYVVPQNMPQIIQANKQRLKSMILYHMFALATQVSNTLVIAPFIAKDHTDSSSDSDLDESSISGPLSGGSIGGVAKVVENIRLKFQISDFKPASLSASIDLMNKRAPDAVYEALVPVSDLAEEMREEMIYNADTGHVMQFIISTQEIKESMDLKNKQRVLQQLSAKAPATWTTAEVTKWLECQDLGHYKGSFIENSISGKEILDLEEDDLKEIGVAKLGHLKKLSKAISELREAKPVGNYRDPTPPRARDTDSIAFKCTFNGDLRMMKFRLTTLAEFTERIAAEYGDVSVKFKDEDDDLILLHETNWDLLVSEAETKRSVNLVISQRQESRLSEQVIRQLGIATTTEAVIVANSNGEIQWVNNAGEQLLGWKSSELLSLAVNKVLSKEMMYYTALEGQYNESEEYTVIHTTDTVRKRDRSTATVQLEIQDREVSSSGHDMIMWLFKLKACEGSASPSKDEVKNVLTQAREAAEKSKDSAIIFDEAGNVQAFNKVACDTFGYKLFEIVGKKVLILIPHYPSIAEFTQACAAGPVLTQDKHGSLLSVQAKLQQIKDGSKLYYSLTLKKL